MAKSAPTLNNHQVMNAPPWVVAEQLARDPLYRSVAYGDEMKREEHNLRLYRLWLQKLIRANYTDVLDPRGVCNFWLLYHILRNVSCPIEDNPELLELRQNIMVRALAVDHLDDMKEVCRTIQDCADYLSEAIHDLKPGQALLYAHALAMTPERLSPEISDPTFFHCIESIPPACLRKFAEQTYIGPRACRLKVQVLPKRAFESRFFQTTPPRPGTDLAVRAVMASTIYPGADELDRRLNYMFHVPNTIKFE